MSYQFKFDSNHFVTNDLCNKITIELSISASRYDYEWSFETIHDDTADCERQIEDFTQEEQTKIHALAEEYAQEHSGEAYQDAIEAAGDRAYDEWKDRQMEEGE